MSGSVGFGSRPTRSSPDPADSDPVCRMQLVSEMEMGGSVSCGSHGWTRFRIQPRDPFVCAKLQQTHGVHGVDEGNTTTPLPSYAGGPVFRNWQGPVLNNHRKRSSYVPFHDIDSFPYWNLDQRIQFLVVELQCRVE